MNSDLPRTAGILPATAKIIAIRDHRRKHPDQGHYHEAHVGAWKAEHFLPGHYLMHDPVTGEVLQTGRMAPAGIKAIAAMKGFAYIRTDDPSSDIDHFVDLTGPAPARAAKTPCPATLDGLVLRNLPVPCRIEVTGPGLSLTEPHDEPELALSFAQPGSYTIRVLSVPHRPGEFAVTIGDKGRLEAGGPKPLPRTAGILPALPSP